MERKSDSFVSEQSFKVKPMQEPYISKMQKARNKLMLRAFLMWSVIDGANKRQLGI